MDLPLIAAVDWSWWGYLAQGILALGVVIFIHEFGHFAAAKLCGVKVLKFYIGFDPYGLRIVRFQWGETEYGIGLIPLGGYVYMLGQTDNPAEQAAEAERAKLAAAEGKPVDPEAAAVWDPRSYPAQSVPERMFIISAGVIMNAVTALIFAIVAYSIGVDFPPAIVYQTAPGSPAWESDFRLADEITKIDDIEKPRWTVDLKSRVMLADLDKGLAFQIHRGDQTIEKQIKPRKSRSDMPPTIGVLPPQINELARFQESMAHLLPVEWQSPAARAEPAPAQGDRVVKINDIEITGYADVLRAETRYTDEPLSVVVKRGPKDAEQEVTLKVAPRPLRELGLAMTIGPIVALQENSPAVAAKFQMGDVLIAINDEPIGDPWTLPERLRKKMTSTGATQEPWNVTVKRTAASSAMPDFRITVTPRPVEASEMTMASPGSPVSLPMLGLAYSVSPKVSAVVADGPAAKAGVKVGDVVKGVELIPADDATEQDGSKPKTNSIGLSETEEVGNWPYIMFGLQRKLPGTKVKLKLEDKREVVLTPVDSPDLFFADRGFIFKTPTVERKAETWGQAWQYGLQDTRDAMTQVYRFLHALWIGQIPMNNLGGIITIADQAGASASVGFSHLLLFLMMLSCNLAVLNFLPIPVLDGGHMVFLAYEGIFRKPPPAALVNFLSIIGFVLLLGLMIFALSNDIRARL